MKPIPHRKLVLIVGICGLMLALCLVVLPRSYPHSGSNLLRVSFLAIGQGDATYLRLPDETSILIDGGPDASVVRELGRVMPWWQRRIDYVIVTHADADHYNGLFNVLDKYAVGAVLYNGDRSTDRRFHSLLDAVNTRRIPLVPVHQDQEMLLSGDVRMRMLWPPKNFTAPSDNAESVVALVSWRDTDFLLTGDLLMEQEEVLMHDYPTITAEVLKVGHHGSKTSSGSVFLKQIKPRLCVISAGDHNRYHHPHPDVIKRLADARCAVITTLNQQTWTVVSDGSNLKVFR